MHLLQLLFAQGFLFYSNPKKRKKHHQTFNHEMCIYQSYTFKCHPARFLSSEKNNNKKFKGLTIFQSIKPGHI